MVLWEFLGDICLCAPVKALIAFITVVLLISIRMLEAVRWHLLPLSWLFYRIVR